MAPNEWRDEARARLRREQRLIGRKTERDINHRTVTAQRLARLEAINRQWHLDANIVRDLAQDFGLFHHRRMIKRYNFGGDRAINQSANFLRHLHKIAARFMDQRWIGGDAVEQARRGKFGNVLGIGGINEEFHEGRLPLRVVAAL